VDQTGDSAIPRRLQQVRGAHETGPQELQAFLWRVRMPASDGEMENPAGAHVRYHLPHLSRIQEVPAVDRNLIHHPGQAPEIGARSDDEVDPRPGLQQAARQVGADEASPAGDQDRRALEIGHKRTIRLRFEKKASASSMTRRSS
jgi:hypothetical protein